MEIKQAAIEALQRIGDFLNSPNARRLEFLIFLLIGVAASFWLAWLQKEQFRTIRTDLDNFKVDIIKKRGRPFKDMEKTKQNLDERVDSFKSGFVGKLTVGLIALLIYGFLIPSGAFAVFLWKYHWLTSSGHSFVGAYGTPIYHPTASQILGLIASQLALGVRDASQSLSAASNFIAFSRNAISYNPSDTAIVWSVMGYRYFIGAFALSLGSYLLAYFHTRFFFVTDQQAALARALEESKAASVERADADE